MDRFLPVPDHYISDFDIEQSSIGPLVAHGRQHLIYRYKETHVIKIPRQSFYMSAYGHFTYDEIAEEISILKSLLPEFIPETRVLRTAKHHGYVIVQELIREFEFITPTNFSLVACDFHKILLGNRSIMQEYGRSLDLLGNNGLQRSLLASLLRQKDRGLMNNVLLSKRADGYSLRIVDFNLLYIGRDYKNVGRFRSVIDGFCFELSKHLLKSQFSLEL